MAEIRFSLDTASFPTPTKALSSARWPTSSDPTGAGWKTRWPASWRPAEDPQRARSTTPPSRAGRNSSAVSIGPPAARAPLVRDARRPPRRPCRRSRPRRSLDRDFPAPVRAPGSIEAFWCCAGSTGPHPPRSWRRSSATRRCTKSETGTSSGGASDPLDRRCYAFFHPALVDEPLIFVEVALTSESRRRRSPRC